MSQSINLFQVDDDSTPLTNEEKQGLKIKWVSTRSELNAVEAQGILNAEKWLLSFASKNVLNETFLKQLHKKMFGNVWSWAGEFRKTERNIGASPHLIREQLRILLDDVRFWIKNQTFTPKEITVRLHHRLVQIHPFANGNGRFSRLVADTLLARQFDLPLLNWGKGDIIQVSEFRKQYISALKQADFGDYTELLRLLTL